MEKFLNSIFAKLLRVLLPASAMVMGAVKGGYKKSVLDENNQVVLLDSHYFDFHGKGLLDWVPLLCMIACAVSVIIAITCLRKETENNLTALSGTLCVAVVINMLMMCFMEVTLMSSLICTVLLIAILITAFQEMKMEDAKKK